MVLISVTFISLFISFNSDRFSLLKNKKGDIARFGASYDTIDGIETEMDTGCLRFRLFFFELIGICIGPSYESISLEYLQTIKSLQPRFHTDLCHPLLSLCTAPSPRRRGSSTSAQSLLQYQSPRQFDKPTPIWNERTFESAGNSFFTLSLTSFE